MHLCRVGFKWPAGSHPWQRTRRSRPMNTLNAQRWRTNSGCRCSYGYMHIKVQLYPLPSMLQSDGHFRFPHLGAVTSPGLTEIVLFLASPPPFFFGPGFSEFSHCGAVGCKEPAVKRHEGTARKGSAVRAIPIWEWQVEVNLCC